jgi:photosystem I subunit 3
MRRLLALILAIGLWMSFAPVASADDVAGLVPCSQSAAFKERAANARPTAGGDPDSAKHRFERYAQAPCGPDGLPHLIVDGRLDRAGDFLIPSILFLYIAGWIGWSGRAYLQAIHKGEGGGELKEIKLDVPKYIQLTLAGVAWPLASLREFLAGEMFAKDDEIPVSPR